MHGRKDFAILVGFKSGTSGVPTTMIRKSYQNLLGLQKCRNYCSQVTVTIKYHFHCSVHIVSSSQSFTIHHFSNVLFVLNLKPIINTGNAWECVSCATVKLEQCFQVNTLRYTGHIRLNLTPLQPLLLPYPSKFLGVRSKHTCYNHAYWFIDLANPRPEIDWGAWSLHPWRLAPPIANIDWFHLWDIMCWWSDYIRCFCIYTYISQLWHVTCFMS